MVAGAITNVHPGADGTVYATYTTTFDICDEYGYCGWFPHAWQVPASQSCVTNESYAYPLTYVGDLSDTSGTQTGTDYFYPEYNPTRICLYASHAGGEYFVADYVYTVPPTPPETTYPGTAPVVETPPLKVREGRSLVPQVLRTEYRRKFTRSTLRRSCWRLTTQKVRCRVSWRKRPYKYRGSVTMWNDPGDPENRFIYRTSIRRKRIKTHRGSSSPPAGASCDPNYSGCLDPNAYDYDCAGGSGDGPRYTGRVRVLGDDHFELDRDGDGVACDD